MRDVRTAPAGALQHPFDAQEASLPRLLRAVQLVFSPLLLLLMVVRILLFLLFAFLLAVVCFLATIGVEKKDEFEPLTGVRRRVSRLAVGFCGRILLLTFGCWPGLFTVNGEWDVSCPTCAVAPHAGALDGFVFLCLGYPRPVILAPYAKIPFVKQILQAAGALLVPIESSAKSSAVSAVDGGKKTNAIADTILRHKRSYDPRVPGVAPIVLFAEGITHSARQLLPFFRGAFEGGSPVQPILLRYHAPFNNAAAWTRPFLDSLGTHVARMFYTPWISITVDYLPPHRPTAAEALDGQLMAEAVRVEMGHFSGLPLHQLGARELRKEMKELSKQRAEAKVTAGYKELC